MNYRKISMHYVDDNFVGEEVIDILRMVVV